MTEKMTYAEARRQAEDVLAEARAPWPEAWLQSPVTPLAQRAVYALRALLDAAPEAETPRPDPYTLAAVLAIEADIEGMKTANIERERNGNSIAYGEAAFFQAANALREIAAKKEGR
jgi:hypothetical protein